LIVGTPTFGKGLVQTLYPLGQETALKLTTARWYTPSGRTIQRKADSEQDQVLQAIAEGNPLAPGDSASAADSAMKARPIFHTDDGRIVRGGGGIVPDLIVRPDTLTMSEREFIKGLGDKVQAYRDVLTTYALDAKRDKLVKNENFQVTAPMRQQVYERLKAKGITMSPAAFQAGSSLLDQQLGYEISRYVFGRPAEFRRRAQDDPQVQTAITLLRKAQSPKQLLTLASAAPVAGPVAR